MQDFLNLISKYFMPLQDLHMGNMEDKLDIGQVSGDYYEGYRDGYNRAVRDFQTASKKALEDF